MRHLISPFIAILLQSSAFYGSDYCPPLPDHEGGRQLLEQIENQSSQTMDTSKGKLPLNWNQQLTGADLISDVPPSNVGLIDTSEEGHFAEVESVFQGSATNSQISFRLNWEDMNQPELILTKVREAKASGKLPRFIGVSWAMGNDPKVAESIGHLREAGVIIVASSGNKGNEALHPNNQLPGVINVGSVGTNGLRDSYSQLGIISAPVGDETYVNTEEGAKLLGGTSYAQPQLLAALGSVDAILPGITEPEILTLLNNTSLQGVSGRQLNHLRLVEVAKKLSANWPQSREDIFSANAKIYDLSDQSRQAEAMAFEREGESRRALLRRAYLLDPDRDDLRRELMSSYESDGFKAMASYFNSLNPDRSEQLQLVADAAHSESPMLRREAHHNLLAVDSEASKIWLELLNSNSGLLQREVLASLSEADSDDIDSEIQDAVVKIIENQKDIVTQGLAWKLVQRHSSQWRRPISYRRTFAQAAPEVQAVAAASLKEISPSQIEPTEDSELGAQDLNDPLQPFLERAIYAESVDLRNQMIDDYKRYSVLREGSGNERLREKLLQDLKNESNLEIWRATLLVLGRLGLSALEIQGDLERQGLVIPLSFRLKDVIR